MDSTVITTESIVEIAKECGVEEKVRLITEAAMAGKLDFSSALRERVALFAGLEADRLNDICTRLAFNPGLRELMAEARRRKIPAFLVSGGFFQVAKWVCEALGMAAFCANQFEIKDKKLTGRLSGDIVDAIYKAKWLLHKCEELGIKPSEVVAVGDGANDIPMLKSVGLAVGFKPKEILRPFLKVALDQGDFRELVPKIFS